MSKEFKINLEKEIGLDEISSSVQETYRSKPTNSTASTPVSNAGIEDSKNVVDPSKFISISNYNFSYIFGSYFVIYLMRFELICNVFPLNLKYG